MIPQIPASELLARMGNEAPRLIDVREQHEYSGGHIPGATWIPMSLVPLRLDEFRSAPPVYVVCRTGNRSGHVVAWLARQGIAAVNVDGGTVQWSNAGGPLVTGMEPGQPSEAARGAEATDRS